MDVLIPILQSGNLESERLTSLLNIKFEVREWNSKFCTFLYLLCFTSQPYTCGNQWKQALQMRNMGGELFRIIFDQLKVIWGHKEWEWRSETQSSVNMDLTLCRTYSTMLLSPNICQPGNWKTDRGASQWNITQSQRGTYYRYTQQCRWISNAWWQVKRAKLKATESMIPCIWLSGKAKIIRIVSYFDWGGDYMTKHVCQKLQKCTVKEWIILDTNYTLIFKVREQHRVI